MKLKDIIAKLLKGEVLTDEEKTFLQDYDPDKVSDAIAAAARKGAEAKQKKAEDEAKELREKLDEATKTADDKAKGASDAFKALQKEVEKLTKAKEDSDAKVARQERASAIHARAKELGVVCAKGAKDEVFSAMLDAAVGAANVTKQDELDAILNAFKADNPALILAGVKGGSGVQGDGSGATYRKGINPWKTETLNYTEQGIITQKDPQLAKQMMAEAGHTDPIT